MTWLYLLEIRFNELFLTFVGILELILFLFGTVCICICYLEKTRFWLVHILLFTSKHFRRNCLKSATQVMNSDKKWRPIKMTTGIKLDLRIWGDLSNGVIGLQAHQRGESIFTKIYAFLTYFFKWLDSWSTYFEEIGYKSTYYSKYAFSPLMCL